MNLRFLFVFYLQMFLDERTTDRLKNMKNGVVVVLLTTTDRFGNEEDIQDIRDVFEKYYNSMVFVWKDLDLKELRQNFYAGMKNIVMTYVT